LYGQLTVENEMRFKLVGTII